MEKVQEKMISAVIPMFNEEKNCLDFTIRLARELSKYGEWEMILMIGGHDSTLNQLSRFWNGYSRVKLRYEPKRGLGTALIKGFKEINPDTRYIFTLDGDGQNLPEEIHKLFATDVHTDIVVGEHTKLVDARSRQKRFVSKVVNAFFSRAYHTGLSDHTSDFRLYYSDVIFDIRDQLTSKNFEIVPEIIIRAKRAGYTRFEEVSINFPPRNGGRSKLSFRRTFFGYAGLVLRLLK